MNFDSAVQLAGIGCTVLGAIGGAFWWLLKVYRSHLKDKAEFKESQDLIHATLRVLLVETGLDKLPKEQRDAMITLYKRKCKR